MPCILFGLEARTTRKNRRVVYFIGSWGERTVTDFGIRPEQLRRLAELVEEAGLSELRYEAGELAVTLRAGTEQPVTLAFPPVPYPMALSAAPETESYTNGNGDGGASPTATVVADTRLIRVEAPLMGVFYRTSSPDDPPFVEVGDTVEVGQVIGLIEAMKVFSEVPSEVGGRVREIPAKNAMLVQPGDTLVILEPME
jgi:acetyl-CoA carboxylase biotin carboxyl carrier protein